MLFEIASIDSNNQTTILAHKYANNPLTLNPFYDFLVPDNSAWIRIRGKAAIGTSVNFYVYDITDITDAMHNGNITLDFYGDARVDVYNIYSFDYTKEIGGSIYFNMGSSAIYLRIMKGSTQISIANINTIASHLHVSTVTSPRGLLYCIEIPSGKKLIFDTKSKYFELVDNSHVLSIDEVLFFSCFNGLLIEAGEIVSSYVFSNENFKLEACLSTVTGHILRFRNGSPGNATNANQITSQFIPFLHKKKITLNVTRPNTTGYYYVYGAIINSNEENVGSCGLIGNYIAQSDIVEVQALSHTSTSNQIIIPDNYLNYAGIQVTIGESNGTAYHPLRVSDFVGHNVLISFEDDKSETNVVDRNVDKIPMLVNACRYHKFNSTSKDYQVLICTDMHADFGADLNAVEATNGFDTIDAYINCGDIVSSYYVPDQLITFYAHLDELTKPGYIVCGNHDVGNRYYLEYTCNHSQAYASFIKPMVDRGWLANGEYETNKPYWYHDDSTYKIRLIGLYEYDDNLDLNETYWKAIAYDNTLDNIAFNTSYVVGTKVKVPHYSDYSFECVQAVTTPANFYTTPEKLPSYKVQRGTRVIRQTQAQWFLDTLASTPQDYGVIVIMHNPFSLNAVSMEKRFSWPSGILGSNPLYMQNSMQTDFIRNAIVAFKNGSNYLEKVVMSGDASYMNDLNDGTIDYAYEVSKDFSAQNSGVYLLGILGGHSHKDLIWKDATENIYQISPNCARVDGINDKNGDVRRTMTNSIARDSLTVASFADERIGLVKIGVNVTENGTFRDYEVLDTNT